MSAPVKFVVVGTGRSGTAYASRLFTQLGYPCGHEDVFGPRGPTARFHAGTWMGEASWLVAPYLDRLPAGTVVFHQLRHPIDVIRSWAGTGFFRPSGLRSMRQAATWALRRSPSAARELRRIVRAATPDTFRHVREVNRCAAHWVNWNHLIERAQRAEHLSYIRYRLEELDQALVCELLAGIDDGELPDPRQVLSRLPRTVNSGTGSAKTVVTIDELSSGVADRVVALASRYGYTV